MSRYGGSALVTYPHACRSAWSNSADCGVGVRLPAPTHMGPRAQTTALRLGAPPTVLNSNVAIFGAGATHTARSCTEKYGPLRGRCYYLTGLYLLFICPTCLIIALKPRSTQVLSLLALSGPRLCGLCELRDGPWGVALLLLHLLLLLTGGKENLAVCHQHKHPCCCCCRRLFLPPAAFAAAIVAALPSWWSCCSSCYPSCAHHPNVSF